MMPAQRVIGVVVGLAFAGIGVILIGWLWLQPFGFMNPPLIFRLLGTMVSIVFVAVGGTAALASWHDGSSLNKLMHHDSGTVGGTASDNRTGYKCTNCGAALSDAADVSPSGDVKCDYCRTWFNVHRSVGLGS